LIGTTVSHYRIVGKLGIGGMGIVYDAEDGRLQRRVALKFLTDELSNDPDATRRLLREAQTIARLNDARICTIHEIDEHEGRLFIAMERLEGTNLKVYMARKTIDTPTVLDIALQVTEALTTAHSHAIVHRDIKPGNIFVNETGTGIQVKVLDFGLARRFAMDSGGESGMKESTMPGRPLGTANYMAPERILQLAQDGRSDLFSLGVVMYEMATGRLPFAGASPAETVTNILESAPVPLTKLNPARPIGLERIVNKLTAKPPADRYQSGAELREDLSRLKSPSGSNLLGRVLRRFRP
jgi:serine/threonine protein kinase